MYQAEIQVIRFDAWYSITPLLIWNSHLISKRKTGSGEEIIGAII